MRNKILLFTFLAGILLFGIGTGVAFGEYSKFTFGGDVALGTEKQEVETMEYVIAMTKEKVRINNYTFGQLEVVEDKTLKDGQVRVEVIANPDYVSSHMYFEDYENTDYDPEYVSGYDGEIQIHMGRRMSGFEVFMEYKDEFLQNLKDSVIKNYYIDAVKSVTVKANANTLQYLEY